MDGLTLLANIRQQYPQVPVLLMTAYANIDGAVRAMREGAIDYLAKPFSPEVLLNQVSRYVPAQKVEKRAVVYGDPKTAELFQLATRVARSEATVMVTGPSGTGKEVLARYIHDNSSRAEQTFVAINCAAIPENMLEATLFGYEKGAFTGAVQGCPGKFEQAQGGTLLLDEITEMDLGLQAKLLRVLQEKEVERLGSRKLIPLDVRVIATSNRDLKKAVQDGLFREDLYYRLNVLPPALDFALGAARRHIAAGGTPAGTACQPAGVADAAADRRSARTPASPPLARQCAGAGQRGAACPDPEPGRAHRLRAPDPGRGGRGGDPLHRR